SDGDRGQHDVLNQGRLENRVEVVKEPAGTELVVLDHAVGGTAEVRDHRAAGGDQRVQSVDHGPVVLLGTGPSGSVSSSGAIRRVMASNRMLPTVRSPSVTSRRVIPSASIFDSAK